MREPAVVEKDLRPPRRWCRSSCLPLLLLVAWSTVSVLAHASLSDQVWMAGIYDIAECDDAMASSSTQPQKSFRRPRLILQVSPAGHLQMIRPVRPSYPFSFGPPHDLIALANCDRASSSLKR